MKLSNKIDFSGYAFITPFLFFSFLFAVLPLLMVVKLSFQTEGILQPGRWVGIENYREIFQNREYWGYFKNNFTFIALTVPFGQFFAITIALLLKREQRLSGFLESVFFLPLLLSMVVAGVLIVYIFSQQGPVNYLLSILGFDSVNWLGDPFRAKVVIGILEIWKGATFHTFLYLAALRAVPVSLYEAAALAGANSIQTFFKITLPMIKGTVLLCVTMTTIWGLQIFDSIYVTTQGGPLEGTTSVVFAVYKHSFKHNNAGLGAALSVVFLGVVLLVTLVERRLISPDSDMEY